MATVRLTRYECERNLLPRVCTRCGAPAAGSVRFGLFTPVGNVLLGTFLAVCPPLFLIGIHVLAKRHNFQVPMCERDEADWRWRDRVATWTYVVFVLPAYCAAAILILSTRFLFPPRNWEVVWFWSLLGYLAVISSWLPPTALMFTRTVRTTKVMKRGIRLSGVHPDFIKALMSDRVAARESDPERVAWYGDLRDDFEEDWNEFGAFRPDAAGEPAKATEPDAPARAD
jgi:hypothetical protein